MVQNRLIWFKGDTIPAQDAKVAVLSPTAQFGLNVFEGIRGYFNPESQDLFLFRLEEHLDRLLQSCKLIGIASPYSKAEISQAIADVISANAYREDIALRVTLFVDGEGSWSSSEPVDMFIAPITKSRQMTSALAGKTAMTSSWERINDRAFPPRIKAGANYINGRYAHLDAVAAGYDLPILLGSDGKVSEGAGSCLMIVRQGKLVTPTVTSSILESITRETLISIARDSQIEPEVRAIDRTELYLADELFLCGSAAEVTPITSLDGKPIGDGAVGPVTKQLHAAYLDIADGTNSAYSNWRSAV